MKGSWICDTCKQAINGEKEGWIEWITFSDDSGKKMGRNLRLVHHNATREHDGCQMNEKMERAKDGGILADMPLDHFLGADGLMRMLSMIAYEELAKEEVLEMIKRLHIPGYEHARFHFKHALAEGIFEPNTPENYYAQIDIEATLRFAEKEGLIEE